MDAGDATPRPTRCRVTYPPGRLSPPRGAYTHDDDGHANEDKSHEDWWQKWEGRDG